MSNLEELAAKLAEDNERARASAVVETMIQAQRSALSQSELALAAPRSILAQMADAQAAAPRLQDSFCPTDYFGRWKRYAGTC